MPYSAEHKARTRSRIVAAARKLFNRRGFSEVSIDEIMDAAGLTRGGFYNHFSRKDELYSEAVRHILTCGQLPTDGLTPARQVLDAYLSDEHLANVDASCPLVAFSSDVTRCGEAVKGAYRDVLLSLIGLFEESLGDQADARSRAVTLATLCVGGLMLARAVDDPVLGDEVRQAARTQGLAITDLDAVSEKRANA